MRTTQLGHRQDNEEFRLQHDGAQLLSSRVPDPTVDRLVSTNSGTAGVEATTLCLGDRDEQMFATCLVSILNHTQTRFWRLRPRPRTRTRPSHNNTIQPKTTSGWLFASGSSWTLRHTGGCRQDTHGTPVPEREGRGWPTTDDLRRTTVRQRHASDKRAFRKTSTDRRAVSEDRC